MELSTVLNRGTEEEEEEEVEEGCSFTQGLLSVMNQPAGPERERGGGGGGGGVAQTNTPQLNTQHSAGCRAKTRSARMSRMPS